MAKVWCPSVPCSLCGMINDVNFNFCQDCGQKKEDLSDIRSDQPEGHIISIKKIQDRIDSLDYLVDSTKYSKQKSSLRKELESFLQHLNPRKSLADASPNDVRKFLIYKEDKGKTQLHIDDCVFKGQGGLKTCKCPRTFAHKSVDSLIGKVRAIFRDFGRTGDWNVINQSGNPAASPLMKRHLHAVKLEQLNACVATKQAKPLFFDKLVRLCRYLSYQLSCKQDQVCRYILLRDRAYFSLLCHSGNRGGDLGLLKLDQISELPQEQGILVNQTAGKTASVDNPHVFAIFTSENPEICPILCLSELIAESIKFGFDYSTGYVFRVKDNKIKEISNKPVTSTSMTDRLRIHLSAIDLYQGETSHSSRRGCAITLQLLDLDDEKINKHIGWKSRDMLGHYANIGGILNKSGIAAKLSKAADQRLGGVSDLDKAAYSVNKITNLKAFVNKFIL